MQSRWHPAAPVQWCCTYFLTFRFSRFRCFPFAFPKKCSFHYQSHTCPSKGKKYACFMGRYLLDCEKKILKHLSLPACASHADRWNVKRKPAPRANGPPTETFIIYDESSSPGADDPASFRGLRRAGPPSVLFLRRDKLPDPAGSGIIELKPFFKKIWPQPIR